MFRKLAAIVFAALVSGAAFADGVPFIVQGPALRANDPAQQLPHGRDFVKMHPIIFVPAAFGANVLTVTIDGTEYRFVGSMMRPAPQAPKTAPPQPKFASWSGKDPGGATLVITKNLDDGDFNAIIELPPSRRLTLVKPGGSTVLIETDRNAINPQNSLTFYPPASAASGVPGGMK